MKLKNVATLFLFIVLSEVIGSIGAIATMPNIPTWYVFLQKPLYTPPNWVFGPVWTILFACMGIATYLVWQQKAQKKAVKNALCLFIIQFSFNVLWSFVFFGLRSPILGLSTIIPLWILILFTLREYILINMTAGLLLVPYLFWVSIATYLNAGIFFLNP